MKDIAHWDSMESSSSCVMKSQVFSMISMTHVSHFTSPVYIQRVGWVNIEPRIDVGRPQNRGWILEGVRNSLLHRSRDPFYGVPSLQAVEFIGASSLGKATQAFTWPLNPIQCHTWNVLGAQSHICMTWCWQNWSSLLHTRHILVTLPYREKKESAFQTWIRIFQVCTSKQKSSELWVRVSSTDQLRHHRCVSGGLAVRDADYSRVRLLEEKTPIRTLWKFDMLWLA